MKLKHYGIALVPLCLAAFLFRAVELILGIDPRTGYFATDSLLPILFDGFLILTALFFCTVLFTVKKEPRPTAVRLYRASVLDTVFGIAGSILLVTEALFGVFSGIADGTVRFNVSLLLNPALWKLVLSLLAAIFLIFFVTYPKRSAKQNGWRIMSLSISLYYLFLLIVNFRDLDVVFSRAFGIYLICFYGIAAAAGINFSKILARLFGRKAFTLFTCLTAVLSAVRLADTVLYLIPGNPYAIPVNLFGFLADACITVLLLSQMKKVMLNRKKRPMEESAEQVPIPEDSEEYVQAAKESAKGADASV